MKVPRSLAIAAGFGLIWALMTYMKDPHDWMTPFYGFIAFLILGPLLTMLIRFIARILRRGS